MPQAANWTDRNPIERVWKLTRRLCSTALVAKTLQFVDSMTKQSGTSDHTFKSALIWCVPDSGRQLCDEARKLLAWEDIQEEASELKLEGLQ